MVGAPKILTKSAHEGGNLLLIIDSLQLHVRDDIVVSKRLKNIPLNLKSVISDSVRRSYLKVAW